MKKIAEHPNELNFAANNIAVVSVDGHKICVGRHDEKYFAFAYKCPHAGGLMANGFIDPLGRVTCPLHRYKFDPHTGINVSGEGFYLRHWPVEHREDGVFVMGLL